MQNNTTIFDLLNDVNIAFYCKSFPGGRFKQIIGDVEEVFGFSPDDFLKNPRMMEKILRPDFVKGYNKLWSKSTDFPDTHNCLYAIIDPDKNERWIICSSKRISDKTGKTKAVEGSCWNVTDLKKAETDLNRYSQDLEEEIKRRISLSKESDEQLFTLLNKTPVGIIIVQDDKILFQNKQMAQISGYLPKDYLISSMARTHEDDVEMMSKIYERVLAKKQLCGSFDVRIRPLDENGNKLKIKHCQIRFALIEYKGRDAILATAIDITQMKEIEKILTVKEKMASLGHMATGLAHEIRNPLTGVNSYLFILEEMIASEELNSENIQMMERIIKRIQLASDKINSIINRVLDFAGPKESKKAIININRSVRTAIKLSEATLIKNSISIKINFQENIPLCIADSLSIEQALLNLISNAVFALKSVSQSATIRIATYSDNGYIIISVFDNGPGIPDKIKKRIFEPYFTTRKNGTGIGLSFVRRVVTDHNGIIEILPGKPIGAEFVIRLPINEENHLT